jgi:glycosyltransferase involved in cell wall biosynthesis
MLKVLHIEDRFHPELGYQLNFFSKYHNPLIDMTIVTSGSLSYWNRDDGQDLSAADEKFEKENQIKIVRLKCALSRNRKANLILLGLRKKIKEISPDIIYIHALETWTCLRIFLMPAIVNKYIIYTDTHTLLNQFRGGAVEKFHMMLLKHIIVKKINKRKIKVLYTVDENRLIAENKYGISPENISPCPIGTDLSLYFYSEEMRNLLRKQFNIENDEAVIIYSGKINDFKKPHLIIDALKLIQKDLARQVKVIMVGAADEKYLQKLLETSRGNEKIKVELIGSVPNAELYKYYSMADFAVFPKENSLSSLDVQACNLPLIMEKDSTNIERLKYGGFIYEKDNIQDLADKIQIFIKNEGVRKKMGNAGKAYVHEYYDYVKIIKNLENHFFKDSQKMERASSE